MSSNLELPSDWIPSDWKFIGLENGKQPISHLIVFSMTAECTSRSSNCFSNLSMTCETFSRLMLFMAESIDFTTLAIDAVTRFVVIALWTLEATALTRADIRR